MQWPTEPTPTTHRAGFRFGDVGTHTSRTLMLAELSDALAAIPPAAARDDYVRAIVEDNVLGKDTAASRRQTLQRLTELYALDRATPLFRVLRRLWAIDEGGRPRLALLAALARDPLLRATADSVLSLPPGAEVQRSAMVNALRQATGERFNDAILDKIARNAASSWAQAGHLSGRVRKVRHLVTPTPGTTALALWLGSQQGLAGDYLLHTPWMAVLDAPPSVFESVLEAKQLGLLHAVTGGNVREIEVAGLDPAVENR